MTYEEIFLRAKQHYLLLLGKAESEGAIRRPGLCLCVVKAVKELTGIKSLNHALAVADKIMVKLYVEISPNYGADSNLLIADIVKNDSIFRKFWWPLEDKLNRLRTLNAAVDIFGKEEVDLTETTWHNIWPKYTT